MTAKNMSIVALVCGIVGIAGGFLGLIVSFLGYIAPLAAIAGIVFGALALNRIKQGEDPEAKTLAMVGFILGIVSTALSVLMVVCSICAVCVVAGALAGTM